MKYSVSDQPLKLREFGRNIQAMVEYALTIEDEELRTRVAHEIIRIMGNLNPSLRENPDYKQKLWDAIHIISDHSLNIESPYPPPPKEEEKSPQKRMEYYQFKPRYRQYGVNVQLMIKKALEMEEGAFKSAYLNLIANTMKQFLRNMDRETTPEQVIAEHMRELSGGKLDVSGDELTITKAPANFNNNNKSNHHHNRGKSNRRGSKGGGSKNYHRNGKNKRRR